jgi:hypothetical protein
MSDTKCALKGKWLCCCGKLYPAFSSVIGCADCRSKLAAELNGQGQPEGRQDREAE